MSIPPPTIEQLRTQFHHRLLNSIWGTKVSSTTKGSSAVTAPSNSDKDSPTSLAIAKELLALPQFQSPVSPTASPKTGQTAGKLFGDEVAWFLGQSLQQLVHLRPAPLVVKVGTSSTGIRSFQQFRHLDALRKMLKSSPPSLRVMFAQDYLVLPDIVVYRDPLSDAMLNGTGAFIPAGSKFPPHTPLRQANCGKKPAPILHASVSCKWTVRSDRVQNTRTEALNLFRNRKGAVPHIVAVTAEPLPSRIESLALGTGDLGCVYHMALPELMAATAALAASSGKAFTDQNQKLIDLVVGQRLRDISDLPFDLIA